MPCPYSISPRSKVPRKTVVQVKREKVIYSRVILGVEEEHGGGLELSLAMVGTKGSDLLAAQKELKTTSSSSSSGHGATLAVSRATLPAREVPLSYRVGPATRQAAVSGGGGGSSSASSAFPRPSSSASSSSSVRSSSVEREAQTLAEAVVSGGLGASHREGLSEALGMVEDGVEGGDFTREQGTAITARVKELVKELVLLRKHSSAGNEEDDDDDDDI